MSPDANATGTGLAASRVVDDQPAERARRRYVAPRLGPRRSVRELTRAVSGSIGDGGGGGTGMMQMLGV
jgi:hypothetical protein